MEWQKKNHVNCAVDMEIESYISEEKNLANLNKANQAKQFLIYCWLLHVLLILGHFFNICRLK